MIHVQYFARYREALGVENETLSASFASIEAVRDHLLQRGGVWQLLADASLMCARNHDLCGLQEPLVDGDAVAFFPPVTGG